MKSIFAAVSLALATTAMPAVAVAQDRGSEQNSETAIVVTGKYQDDWDKGNKLKAEGVIALEEAQKVLDRYNAEVAAAQSARDTAQSRAINARSEFHSLASQAVSISNPDKARRLGQDLEKFGERWEDLNDTVRSAQNDLDKASKKQRKAQASVDKAQAKVDRGEAMMAEAERLTEERS
ncbi:hypothetical protein OIK40_04195 [Erythrobacter sp. sf7]|uniref:Uncharacterized protein n=1 Tax=Erythrobacter fulvus TaxID=2987523 RepID=A0ABT5JNA9_9SPHN|nr:hypothetical protein [Erythrobacter fulvus]MDC8753840.1 hypothetical protein [Erythrobacter fulvus]